MKQYEQVTKYKKVFKESEQKLTLQLNEEQNNKIVGFIIKYLIKEDELDLIIDESIVDEELDFLKPLLKSSNEDLGKKYLENYNTSLQEILEFLGQSGNSSEEYALSILGQAFQTLED